MSFEAQVVTSFFQKNISSATLQPYKLANSSSNLAFETKTESLSGKNHVTHNAHPLDTIEILFTGSQFGENFHTKACHTS
jgi:hypothetical protein